MSRLSLTLLGGVLALSLAAAPGARAQALPPMDYSQYDVLLNTLGISNLPAGQGQAKRKPPRKRRAAPPQPTTRQRASLRFRPAATVTQTLYQEVVERSGQDPAIVALTLDAAKAEYRRVLVRVAGWRVNDLGDAAAFALVQAYVKVRDVDDAPKRGLALLRRAVADDLARRKPVRRLSDARQQAIAERLELRTIFLISGITGAEMIGDAGLEARARGAMRAWAKDVFGLDIAGVRLTRDGLVRR